MNSVATLAYWEGMVLVCGFFGIIFWKLFTGEIRLNQLLHGDRRDPNARDGSGYTTEFSPGRAQLLMVTIIFATNYLLQVLRNPTAFPDVPPAMLAVLGGSQAVYLGGKAKALLLGNIKDLLR